MTDNDDLFSRLVRVQEWHLAGCRWIVLLLAAALAGLLETGCCHSPPGSSRNSSASASAVDSAAAIAPTPGAPLPGNVRIPLPLLPRMAEHQLENMRDHLAAIQEITAALARGDFENVARAAARIGYSEQMGRMCERMGAGAPGFNQLALQFHRTADTIGIAASRHDSNAVLVALGATLQTCVGCHAVYQQQIVSEAAWKRISRRAATANPDSSESSGHRGAEEGK